MSNESTVDNHATRISTTVTDGRILLADADTGRLLAALPLPAAVGLAATLCITTAGHTTDTAPELAGALFDTYGTLHQITAAWQRELYPAPRFWHPDPYGHTTRSWPAVPDTVTAVCDNKSVGVLITDEHGRYLFIDRVRPPVGKAPVAGHIDQHGTAQDAAVAEVAEEVGLTVTNLTQLTGRWRTNICRRHHGPMGPGHDWTIYHAQVTGTVTTDPAETTNATWYTREQMQHLAERAAAYAAGEVSTEEWTAAPGIEPVWVEFLAELDLITLTAVQLAAVNRLAGISPYQHTT